MRIFWTTLTAVTLIALTGCDEPTSTTATPATTSAPSPSRAPSPDDAPSPGDTSEDNVERQVAEVGVGKKGRNYGGGVISEPVRAYFRTQQRLEFIKVQQAMNLYKASHDGLPESHEVFMKDIVEANGIQLPELPAGERYVYDPEQGELMVERPQ